MMQVRITHLEMGDGGYYLLFTGDTEDWLYVKDRLKSQCRGPYKGAWYVFDYEWPNRAKPGAWWVSGATLARLRHFFSNLEEMLEQVMEDDEDDAPPMASNPPPPPLPKMPVTLQDAFAVLKLPMSASHAEVKKAYRTLATAYHPDHGGDADKMKSLNIANDIIQRWMLVHSR
jgi:DnaJ domain